MNVLYVKFNRLPVIEVRQIENNDRLKMCHSKDGKTRTVEEDKKIYPLQLKDSVIATVFIKDGSKFSFKIHEKYCWNGADIPRFVWRVVGSQYNPEFLQPSMIHDFILEHKANFKGQKDLITLSTDIFKSLLLQNGVRPFKADIMAFCVQFYQKKFNKKRWG